MKLTVIIQVHRLNYIVIINHKHYLCDGIHHFKLSHNKVFEMIKAHAIILNNTKSLLKNPLQIFIKTQTVLNIN